MYGFESSAESIILGAAFEAGQMRLGRREIFFTDLAIQRHEVGRVAMFVVFTAQALFELFCL
jgi:hypothetical protein